MVPQYRPENTRIVLQGPQKGTPFLGNPLVLSELKGESMCNACFYGTGIKGLGLSGLETNFEPCFPMLALSLTDSRSNLFNLVVGPAPNLGPYVYHVMLPGRGLLHWKPCTSLNIRSNPAKQVNESVLSRVQVCHGTYSNPGTGGTR